MKNKDTLGGSTRCLITRRAISSQPLKSGAHVCRSLGLQSRGQLFPIEIFSTPGVQDLGSCLSVAHLRKWCVSVDLVWGYLLGSSLLVVTQTEEQQVAGSGSLTHPQPQGNVSAQGIFLGETWNLGAWEDGALMGHRGAEEEGRRRSIFSSWSDVCGWGGGR